MTKKTAYISAIIIAIFAFGGIVFSFKDAIRGFFYEPDTNAVPKKTAIKNSDYGTFVDYLTIPWEIVFTPNKEMLVTERPGNLIIINLSNLKKTKIKLADISHAGEGGLLGMVLHPDFSKNHWIYLYFTAVENGNFWNRVVRFQFIKHQLSNPAIIIDHIPGAKYHDGGRIKFGPDKKLYITTGDATQKNLSQNTDSIAGKILRLNDDGSVPQDNPFNNPIYCYGLRNPQGLAWDEQGRLWAVDHGRSFVLSGYDELNLIQRGKNYGWPVIQGSETRSGMVPPVIHSGPDVTWAPADNLYYRGSIFFTGLHGESLYQYTIKTRQLKRHFFKTFGRLRAIVLHEGFFYISTSNRDGRGEVSQGDDKIIKINPIAFTQ